MLCRQQWYLLVTHETQHCHLSTSCLQATHLIKYLQSMKGRRLWSYEDLSLGQQQQLPSAIALAGLVQHCLNALSFEEGLQASWCEVSLEWALHAHSRHLACRSQQVRMMQGSSQRSTRSMYITA